MAVTPPPAAAAPLPLPHSLVGVSPPGTFASSVAPQVAPLARIGHGRVSGSDDELRQLRNKLAVEMGFPLDHSSAQAFLAMCENRISRGSSKDYLDLFLRTVQYFSKSCEAQRTIGSWIERLVEQNDPIFRHCDNMRDAITDRVFCILGSWTSMVTYFMKGPSGYRPIVYAYATSENIQGNWEQHMDAALNETLPDLMTKSHLLMDTAAEGLMLRRARSYYPTAPDLRPPHSSCDGHEGSNLPATPGTPLLLHTALDDLQFASISSNILNAHTLRILAGVQILWTMNISRHLLLSSSAGCYVLEIYALPSILHHCGGSLAKAGISDDLRMEVLESYALLFNPRNNADPHGRRFGVWRRWWCWCVSCSSRRLRKHELAKLSGCISTSMRPRYAGVIEKSEYDLYLETDMVRANQGLWNSGLFPLLWPRITIMDEHLSKSKPWNFWVLFRDRRDSLPFWTFFFATFVVILTVVQVGLGIAQVVGSFGGK